MKITASTINSLNNVKLLINKTSEEIASGRKNLNSSELYKSLSVKEDISHVSQSINQIENFKIKTNAIDSSLSNIKEYVSVIKDTMIRANTSTTTNKNLFMSEISNLKESIKSELSTNINNQYIFQGQDSNKTPSFSITDKNYEKVLVSPGEYKTFELSTSDILNVNNESLLDILDTIENKLNTGEDLSSEIDKIENAYNSINVKHAYLGSFNSSLDRYIETNSAKETQLKIYQSNIEDVDFTEAAIRLNSLQNQYSAIALTISKIQSLSLVNFLKF